MLEHRSTAINDALERSLLEKDSPPSHADAGGLLKRNKIAYKRVVSVEIDSILFVDEHNRPSTAWLKAHSTGPTRVWVQVGFAAEPGYVRDE